MMKFAKTLEQDCVPEWRLKYLDYKTGKKRVKAVVRAINHAKGTPRTPARPSYSQHRSLYGATAPVVPRSKASERIPTKISEHDASESLQGSTAQIGTSGGRNQPSADGPLTASMDAQLQKTPRKDSLEISKLSSRRTLELPEPALDIDSVEDQASLRNAATQHRDGSDAPRNAYKVGTPKPRRYETFTALRRSSRSEHVRPLLRRLFSVGAPVGNGSTPAPDIDMEAMDLVRQRQREFFQFMDKELNKVETFYRSKEDEAGLRLDVLREQLHEMRNRKLQEDVDGQQKSWKKDNRHANGNSQDAQGLGDPFEKLLDQAKSTVREHVPGFKSQDHTDMGSPTALRHIDDGRDYVRRPISQQVSFRSARRKLKLALQELYRGMELLKSYALLNRTAFRKINKKYDKAIDAHPPQRYISDKVDKAWFVQSDIIDGHMQAVEDLYARYFEKGNRKVAAGKLRSPGDKSPDKSISAFRNGLCIGVGAVFTIQGIIDASKLLHHVDPVVRVQTAYLMQIYGGYLLALYLFSWFCLDCWIWTRNKINYAFVFEFDQRHNLDWRELSEFPSFIFLLFGLFVWATFSRYGPTEMYIYFPVILIFVTVLMIFLPARFLYHRSRKWFAYSHWRLLLAGLYPVEFRDFLLGDMYCSLTYVMANIELFFCLYSQHWTDPPQCNSSHSRLMGFFAALPGIWRALQCLRRYHDTRNVFPHLVNCGKYTMTILFYVTLSLYRMNRSSTTFALFNTFATLNGIYVSVWDLVMDWSLLQPQAKHPFLRHTRAFKSTWPYYMAIILDPILRFNWIFYSIYTHNTQHNTKVSFLVALSEVTRRGMWTIFRVENEHCANVNRFKASRDVPLPYVLDPPPSSTTSRPPSRERGSTEGPLSTFPSLYRHRSGTASALEAQHESPGNGTTRRRMPRTRTLTDVLAEAHTQDFEKKRRPAIIEADDDGDTDGAERRTRSSSQDGEGRASGGDSSEAEDETD